MEDEIGIKTIRDELAIDDKVELIVAKGDHFFGTIIDNIENEYYIKLQVIDKSIWIINTQYIVAFRLVDTIE